MIIRAILLTAGMAMSLALPAQNRYFTKTGHIDFFSQTPIEDIRAENDQVTSFLDVSNGEIVFSVLIRSFGFAKPLMQEHFNENYLESEKFPKASFSGKYTSPNPVDPARPGKYPVTVAGKLTIHGVAKEVSVPAVLTVEGGRITGEAVFSIKPEEYGIRIPAVVRKNIAETIRITARMVYLPYLPDK